MAPGKIVTNSVLLVGAEAFRRFFRFGLVVVSARVLGDAQYGDFSFGLAYTSMFLILADLGLHKLIIRELARAPEKLKKYLGNGLVLKAFLAVLTFMAITGFLRLRPVSEQVRNTVYLLALFKITFSYIEFFKAIFQAYEKMKYDACATLIQTISLTCIGIGVLLAGGGIQMLAAAYLAANVITLIYQILIMTARFTPLTVDFEPGLIRNFVRDGLPIGINYFFSTFYTFVDTVMLSWMVNSQVVGWYNVAYRLVFALQSMGVGILRSVFPGLSGTYHLERLRYTRLFQKTWKTMIYFGFTSALLFSLLANKIILLIYGIEYIRAGLALSILVWTTPFMFINTLMSLTATSADRQRFSAWAMGISAFFNVLLNFFLIPRYSFVGAAATTLATQGLNFAMHYFYLRRYIVRPLVWWSLWRVVLINTPAAVFIIWLRDGNLFFLGGSAAVLTLLMTRLTGYFDAAEMESIKSMFLLIKRRK